MQLDMHFYGIYALARAAGVKPEIAKKIAYASQFVDDAIEDEAVEIENQKAVLPTMTSHRPLDLQKNPIAGDQWKVWIPFHFLPGNKEDAESFLEKLVCQKNSESSKKIIEHALDFKEKPFGPHLAGITAHVFADTFAHHGFIGLNRDYNKVKMNSVDITDNNISESVKKYILRKAEEFKAKLLGTVAELLPIGHAAVYTFPDRPYLKWTYQKEDSSQDVPRDNPADYLLASEKLYQFFKAFLEDNSTHGEPYNPVEWESIFENIHEIILYEGSMDERCDKWKDAIKYNKLFEATDKDKNISYFEKAWKSSRIIYHFAQDKSYEECNGCMYFKAAWNYRNYVLNELFPSVGLFVGEEVS